MVADLMKKYPDDVKVVIKNFPLSSHKQANKAALYALASARQGKFYEMYHKIFDNYKELRKDEDLPLQFAAEMGLNVEQLKQDIKDPSLQKQINDETAQLKNTGMRLAVPKFLINGKEPQARSIDAWSSLIEGYLKKK